MEPALYDSLLQIKTGPFTRACKQFSSDNLASLLEKAYLPWSEINEATQSLDSIQFFVLESGKNIRELTEWS